MAQGEDDGGSSADGQSFIFYIIMRVFKCIFPELGPDGLISCKTQLTT